jgi:thiol:disulfide interchange protein
VDGDLEAAIRISGLCHGGGIALGTGAAEFGRLWRRARRHRADRIGGVGLSKIARQCRRRQDHRPRHRLIALLIAVVLPVRFANVAAATTSVPTVGTAPRGDDEWLPYSAAKVAELSAAGKPLLVNFTASWCLTCLVNERSAFADAAVQAILRNKNVTLMKGDWTNRDPAITQALADFGRAGVPLYVVYNSKPGSPPVVLPQILTAGIVESAFADAPGVVTPGPKPGGM